MNESIFHRLEDDWQHAAQHFRHHGPTISGITPPQPQGAPVSLAAIVADIKNLAEDGEAKFRTILDEHLPQAVVLAEMIETNPIFTDVENALHVPPEILAGVQKILKALAAEFPKLPPAPAEVPQAEAPQLEPSGT